MPDPASNGFAGITTAGGPNPSALNSIMESFASAAAASHASEEASATADSQTTLTDTATTSAATTSATTSRTTAATTSATASAETPSNTETSGASKTGASTASEAASSNSPTTFATSTMSLESPTTVSDTTSIQSNAGTAASAASSTSATAVALHDKCNSISCNSRLEAAIAVPIVVVVLLAFGLIFCLARRRRRRVREALPPVEEKAKPKKKWSRHLRVFSFGEELLMGGRYSSSNSMRTGDGDSMASVQQNTLNHHHDPSLHSVDEEVAPPYRDSISHAERPLAGIALIPRPSSAATAPPPYGFAAAGTGGATGRTSRATDHHSQRQPLTPTSNQDPFQDGASAPVSPAEESPFNHPDDDEADDPQPLISRQSSVAAPFHDGTSMNSNSMSAASDTGSIREAQIARGVSMSGARAVTVTRNSAQQLSDSGR
ncbi:hypothetical protein DV736_g6107, partial [Chaetothyriales sp. CBS 134916]